MNKNKGFSLVEIIIVIAIMAILIGVMSPAMVKYVEKTKIVSDQQLLESIAEAIIYASTDSEISDDADVKTLIASMENTPCTLESLMTPANNKLAAEIQKILKWSDLNQTTYEKRIRSTHNSNCTIYISRQGGDKKPLILWITTTDKTGGHDTSNTSNTVAGIGNCISLEQ